MELFKKKTSGATLAFGTALTALVGAETVSAEQANAANEELTAAGVTGAQLITQAAFDDLSAKVGRVDTAEAAVQATTDAVTAAGATDVADLIAQRDEAVKKAAKYGSQPGALGTSAEKQKSDVEEGADEHQKAIDELPHNQALVGHPMFG